MPVPITTLRGASLRRPTEVASSITEARARGLRTAFLCHSHTDATLVRGLVVLFIEAGWRVYIDWADPSMPSKPNRETAARLKTRIVACDYFLFLATSTSMASRWCPWEIGYADGKKDIEKIFIIPTVDGATTHGSEYLDLYRRIDQSATGAMGAFAIGSSMPTLLSTL